MFNETYEVKGRFSGTILSVCKEELIVATGGLVQRCDHDFRQLNPIGVWDKSWRSGIRQWSLANRFLRLGLGPSAWLGDTLVVVTRNVILRIQPHSEKIELVPLPSGIRAPVTLSYDPGRDGEDDALLFGEYKSNLEMDPVALFRLKRTGSPELICYTKRGQVNHIHSIIPSADSNNYYVLSGDFNHAARIWSLGRESSSLEPITPHGQEFRSCWLVETENGFLYATDRQDSKNYLYSFDKQNAKLNIVSEINGCSIDFLSCKRENSETILFSTTVEGNYSKKMTISHFFNIKKGAGVQSREAVLYRYHKSKGQLERVFSVKKDWLPFVPFQFGRLRLPPQSGEPGGSIFVNATAVYGNSHGAFRLDQRKSPT